MVTHAPELMTAQVMHKRLRPVVNQFTYGVAYLHLPMSKLWEAARMKGFSLNQANLFSFHFRDHGERSDSNPLYWAERVLQSHGLREVADGEITLLCLPRVLGYAFKPVSFWLCHDRDGQLRAVISEVHNTFGETHSYISHHDDLHPIGNDDWMESRKIFHVSPFLKVEGHYRFRFALTERSIGVWINYYDAEGEMLLTSLTGAREPMTAASIQRAFWRYPWLGIKVIALIHWQAAKLWLGKRIPYISKPKPPEEEVSR